MSAPSPFTLRRYFASKRSVDDRALHRPTYERLRAMLADRGASPLRVLEIGGGTGSMVQRALEWKIFPAANYHLVDIDPQAIAELPDVLRQWANAIGVDVEDTTQGLRLRSSDCRIELSPQVADIKDFLRSSPERFDLVICHAVVDLMDVPALLKALWPRMRPEAPFWFTIAFDGETILSPAHPHDAAIFSAYHGSIDARGGNSRSGRQLFTQLRDSGARIELAGSSDWVIVPQGAGYPADEEYFLQHILHFVDEEMQRSPCGLSEAELTAWLQLRRKQVAAGQLMLVAHQLDYTGRAPATEQ